MMVASRCALVFMVGLISLTCVSQGAAKSCPFNGRQTMFPDLPCHDWAIGPGVAYFYDGRSGVMPTLDVAYTYEYFAASANLGHLWRPDGSLSVVRSEFSYWLLVTWGAGFGYAFGDDHGPLAHVFAGFPLGDDQYFVEPYYRANLMFLSEFELGHEVGMMFKYTTYSF